MIWLIKVNNIIYIYNIIINNKYYKIVWYKFSRKINKFSLIIILII